MSAEDRNLSTADLAAAAEPAHHKDERPAPGQAAPVEEPRARPDGREPAAARAAARDGAATQAEEEQLAALFAPEMAQQFRSRWDAVQIGFVDDPKQAVRQADELVAQVMKSLAQTFSDERSKLEAHLNETDRASTENLRMALRRYRSFFQRLLSL